MNHSGRNDLTKHFRHAVPTERIQTVNLCIHKYVKFMKMRKNGNRLHESAYSTQQVFGPILILLQVLGVETLPQHSPRRLRHSLLKSTRYAAIVWVVTGFLMNCIYFILQKDQKTKLMTLLITISRPTLYFSLFRSCLKIQKLLDKVPRMAPKDLQKSQKIRKIRKSAYLYSAAFSMLDFAQTLQYFIPNVESLLQSFRLEEIFGVQKRPWNIVFPVIIFVFDFISWSYAVSLLHLFSVYYSVVCDLLTFFWEALYSELQGPKVEYTYMHLIRFHDTLHETMQVVDDMLSFPVFISVFGYVIEIFWAGYELAFESNINWNNGLRNGFHLSVSIIPLVKMILSASATSVVAERVHMKMSSLPAMVPARYEQLEILLKKKCYIRNRFTLWKIYDIDRSLVISLFANLFTYGVIIGTLGKYEDSQKLYD